VTAPTQVLIAAARRTQDAGSARVRAVMFPDPPPADPRHDFTHYEDGVIDLARRRTRVTQRWRPGGAVETLGDTFEERWPWLAGDPDDDGEVVVIHAGEAAWLCSGERTVMFAGDPASPRRGHTDPAWIFDALCHAGDAHERDDGTVGFFVDLAAHPDAIAAPPHGRRARPAVTGHARIDAQGRVDLATWTFHRRGRTRRAQESCTWHTVELSDFGPPVDIVLPPVDTGDDGPLLVEIYRMVRDLRRRKREWERSA
jgi:hypothetical protein